jgi:acyl-CoA synthetase (AMP-forming)/AMP-acid ligase II
LEGALEGCDEYVDTWGSPFANPDRPVFVRQTSGTTGTPKVVVGDICPSRSAISHFRQRLVANVESQATRLVCLVAAPFSHAAGLHAFAMLTLGAKLILLRDFDVVQVLAAIARHRVTHMWLPASALNLLLAHRALGAFDCSSLRQILIGASAASPAKLREAVSAFGACIAVHYGQIEGGFLTWLDEKTLAAAARGDRPERLSSSGTTMDVGRVSITSDDGREVPCGQVGEIVVRSLSVKPWRIGRACVPATVDGTCGSPAWRHSSWCRFSLRAYLTSAPSIAFPSFAVMMFLASVFFGPSFAMTQALAPVRMRSVATSLLLFVQTLIGYGLGPLIAGRISDRLMPFYGSDSLRYALVIVGIANVWAAWHYFLGSRTLREELRLATADAGHL